MNISFPVLHTDALKIDTATVTRKDAEILAEISGNKEKNNTMESIIDNNANGGWAYGD